MRLFAESRTSYVPTLGVLAVSRPIGGRPFREHAKPLQVAGALLSPDAAHPSRTARGHLRVVAASNAR